MDLTAVVGTFGDEAWIALAQERAIPSITAEGIRVVHTHRDTLAEARNAGLLEVTSEWVCHVDADDELEPGYVEAVVAGRADLRAPAVRYVHEGRAAAPRVPRVAGHRHECTADCLPEGNWLVVGTAVRTELVLEVGGWRDFHWSEDWDLWIRCWQAGATIEAVPEAVYRAHVRPDSRNRAPDREFKDREHWRIHRANFPELYEEAIA